MKTNNAALATFIDEKYIPLAPKIKLGITVGIILIPLVIFYFAYYQQKAKQIDNLSQQKTTLAKQVEEVKVKAADLAKFQKELDEAEEQFLAMAVLLPKEKEIPKLLKDISALGRNAGSIFLPLSLLPTSQKTSMQRSR